MFPIFAIFAIITFSLISVNTVTARAIEPYPLRCNNKDLGIQIWADCVKHLREFNDMCEVISSTERKQYCRHVYGLSLDDRQQKVPCGEVVLVLAELWAACHTEGGSAHVASNDQFVVHVA